MSKAKIVPGMEKSQNKSHQLLQARPEKEKIFHAYNLRMEDTHISA